MRDARHYITQSVAMHPSLFVGCLNNQAGEHNRYVNTTTRDDVAKIANQCALDCWHVAKLVEAEDVDAIMADMRYWIPALQVAARLNCVGHLMKDIVEATTS